MELKELMWAASPSFPNGDLKQQNMVKFFTKNGISSIEMWISSMHEAWG
jgi:hypothetical protein